MLSCQRRSQRRMTWTFSHHFRDRILFGIPWTPSWFLSFPCLPSVSASLQQKERLTSERMMGLEDVFAQDSPLSWRNIFCGFLTCLSIANVQTYPPRAYLCMWDCRLTSVADRFTTCKKLTGESSVIREHGVCTLCGSLVPIPAQCRVVATIARSRSCFILLFQIIGGSEVETIIYAEKLESCTVYFVMHFCRVIFRLDSLISYNNVKI